MITSIGIQGFKRFQDVHFDAAPLTVLTGLNGSGKTSVIQALLVASEAAANRPGGSVRLNGPFGLDLGTAGDIRNWKSDEDIAISVRSEAGDARWEFGVPSEDALFLSVLRTPNAAPVAFSRRPRAFCYLSAERFGPRSSLGGAPQPATALEVGARGEHCAQILDALGDKPIDERRAHPFRGAKAPKFLKYEVEHWLADIARAVEIDAVRYPGSAIFALRFRSIGGDWVSAPNMGFGLSYALPVILAGLATEAGGLLIVENPEAHLHPAGQSQMGGFLAWLAGRGVQVIAETHSDHVLNGIRRAIGEHKFIAHDQAIVHYFTSGAEDEFIAHTLSFTSMGAVTEWPKGFFDQYQTDVASLGRIRRGS